jgi:hypothetical protein
VSGFGSAFGDALAAAGPAVGPALQAAGAAAADPHATAMALAVSAAQAKTAQAVSEGVSGAAAALKAANEAAAGLRPASDAVAAAAAMPSAAAAATPGATAGLAAAGDQFSPTTAAGAPGVVCPCSVTPAADNPAVEIVWPPNRGFDGDPVTKELAPGAKLSRYGGWIDENGQFQDKGSFVAPHDVPYEMRALPAGTDLKPLSTYEVLKPIAQVPSGPAAPWFGQPGGGVQHDLPMSINKLLEGGYIRVIDRVIPG